MRPLDRLTGLRADPLDFAPALVRIQARPPAPLPRWTLYIIATLLVALLVWAVLGRLDIVAVAQGKLTPQTYVKIVQPAEGGMVKEILVREGMRVSRGQVLARMDKHFSDADNRTLERDLKLKGIQARFIEAEIGGAAVPRLEGDPAELFGEVARQWLTRKTAFTDTLATEEANLRRANSDFAAAQAVQRKLEEVVPMLRESEAAFEKLARDGFAGPLLLKEKSRERMEKEQDLRTQTHNLAALRSQIDQVAKRIVQLRSAYASQLHAEFVEVRAQHHKLAQDWSKQAYRHELLELKAPQSGVVKDIATHTPGTVITPGTVLVTLVPDDEPVHAEVWVSNQDSGFVQAGQVVKVKVATYPFQKYGFATGTVRTVSADASDKPELSADRRNQEIGQPVGTPLYYKALVALDHAHIEYGGKRHPLTAGMQVVAEVKLGTRSVMEYLLSPVQKAAQEAGRER